MSGQQFRCEKIIFKTTVKVIQSYLKLSKNNNCKIIVKSLRRIKSKSGFVSESEMAGPLPIRGHSLSCSLSRLLSSLINLKGTPGTHLKTRKLRVSGTDAGAPERIGLQQAERAHHSAAKISDNASPKRQVLKVNFAAIFELKRYLMVLLIKLKANQTSKLETGLQKML